MYNNFKNNKFKISLFSYKVTSWTSKSYKIYNIKQYILYSHCDLTNNKVPTFFIASSCDSYFES